MSSSETLTDADLELLPPEQIELGPERLRRLMRGWFTSRSRDEDESEDQPLTSIHELGRERTRRALTQLISRLATEGLSFDDRFEYKADPRSAAAASALIRQLPYEYQFPKVAPDDDGDLVMVWKSDRTVLLTMEAWKLHIVVDPATPKSKHLPEMMFDGEMVPRILLDLLPTR